MCMRVDLQVTRQHPCQTGWNLRSLRLGTNNCMYTCKATWMHGWFWNCCWQLSYFLNAWCYPKAKNKMTTFPQHLPFTACRHEAPALNRKYKPPEWSDLPRHDFHLEVQGICALHWTLASIVSHSHHHSELNPRTNSYRHLPPPTHTHLLTSLPIRRKFLVNFS